MTLVTETVQFVQSSPYLATAAVLGLFITYVVLDNYELIPSRSIVRNIPSAGRGNWLSGHFPNCFSFDPDLFSFDCYNRLGPIHSISGLLGKRRIVIQDSKALSHVIKNAYDYPKTNIVRNEIGQGIGHGVLWEEGPNHKRQRRMLNPAFSTAAIRDIAPAFTTLALQLAERLEEVVEKRVHDKEALDVANLVPGTAAGEEDGAVLDLYHWFFRVALDAIGLGGFGRDYGSIQNEEQGIAQCFAIWSANEELDLTFKGLVYKILDRILPYRFTSARRRILDDIQQELGRDAQVMFDERKAWLANGGSHEDEKKDVFTILMKANSEAAAAGDEKLPDSEVFNQIKTFIFAGHETSSTGLSWTCYLLAKYPNFQERLREEIMQAKADAEDMGLEQIPPQVLDALPMLDAVLRESLRYRPPIPGRSFVAQKDDVLPLAEPLKLNDGRVLNELPIKKGQELYTWHTLTNKRQDVWGYDSFDFNPDRWIKDIDAGRSGNLKGAALYGGMMSFFGGPRSCIGYRFALVEMKAIIAVLIERFQFHDTAVPVSARTFIVMRPSVEAPGGKMINQMPLRVTKIKNRA